MSVPWQLPVMQAPIGPATTTALVTAVSSAGGLGTLAASWTEPETLREQLRRIRSQLEDQPFCVNLVLAFDQRERLTIALAEGAPFISFSWGVDRELFAQARQTGAAVLVQVADVASAREALAAGADILIAQGVEAGGHVQSVTPLAELVRELQPFGVPIVAAGGIGDADAARSALDNGASTVACGTAYLGAEEANVHPQYLEAVLSAGAGDTVLTSAFDGDWPDAPHRVIRNDTLTAWESAGSPRAGSRPGEGDVVATRDGHPIARYDDAQPTSSTEGDIHAMAMYAGRSVGAVSRRAPAAEITRELAGLR
jgi:NAD(P)H-dependent flavin oxidoreductase YrpB (nitropropane dioxygenase family)